MFFARRSGFGRALLLCFFVVFSCLAVAQPPNSFNHAKSLLRQVYDHDARTFYCDCAISWRSGSSGTPQLKQCGYQVRKNSERANRIEWEHVVPAHTFGQQRACWRSGGRSNCTANDPVFRIMEADMHNLVPSIGEVNGDRSNFRFAMLPDTPSQYGVCDVRIDFQQRAIQPREAIRGEIARINFYMYDRYNINLSRQQEQLFMAWDKMYPVSEAEHQRHEKIMAITGIENGFVSGKKVWQRDYKPSGEGLKTVASQKQTPAKKDTPAVVSAGKIRGNKNSKVYHLATGCPGYNSMKESNIVLFDSEKAAQQQGFRKAGNCRN